MHGNCINFSECGKGGFDIRAVPVIITLLLLLGVANAADKLNNDIPVSVTVEVNRNSVGIGDKIKYTITVKIKKGIDIEFPEFGENLAEFSIKDFGSSTGGFLGRKTLTQWYVLDTYETGSFTIPSVTVKYKVKEGKNWKEVQSEEIGIEVKSVLNEKDTETSELQDIKGPLSYQELTYLYIILAIVTVIIISVVIFFLKKKKVPKHIMPPPRPAHEIAYEALRKLRNEDYLNTGEIRKYYFELSDIVRHYLENRFSMRAPEMTTEEFLSSLKNTDNLESGHKSLLRDFLSHCDMVKFAKYRPDEREINLSYESAKKLVDQTKETADVVK